ncbi:MAG: hypothetical protein JW840_01930 [Candidatus Thermoplasmatota archaeon]|nr:hypothetical protein [Candidatus Thermoplasmatota archaeon]
MRWEYMLDTADVTRQFIETIIDIIGRKTSEEYAAVAIRNLLKKLEKSYSFLQAIEIKNSRTLELEGTVKVQEQLNTISPLEVGLSLQELLRTIMKSLGKTAGYFFIRETREKIGINYDRFLLKSMDLDLSLMQSMFIVEKKTVHLLDLQNSDILRRFLKVLIDVVEKQTSKAFAINTIKQHVDVLKQHYPFLTYLSMNDVRYTLGTEEIALQPQINTIEPQDVGRAIKSILQEIEKTLSEIGRNSIVGDLKGQLTFEYLGKLNEMGVALTSQNVGYNALFSQVIKTLVDALSKKSSENNAISLVNSFLRKNDNKYEFLKKIKVEPSVHQDEPYHIIISDTFDTISDTDVRRAIQQLLENILQSLEKQNSEDFIQQFKESLDKKYLLKIEEIGVNFHMIELHQAMSP